MKYLTTDDRQAFGYYLNYSNVVAVFYIASRDCLLYCIFCCCCPLWRKVYLRKLLQWCSPPMQASFTLWWWKPLASPSRGVNCRGGSTLGQGGALAPTFTCCPSPPIQKLADRSDVISEVSKCSKIQIFWGAGELTVLPRPPNWSGGGLLPLPRTPPPLSALWASFLRVSGSNPL